MADLTTNLTNQLKGDEGTVLHAYKDSRGYLTIGTGICIDAAVPGSGITGEESDHLLANRLSHAAQQVEETWPWTSSLDDARLGVLLNMAFNMGVHGLGEFRQMLGHLQVGDYDKAAEEMRNSRWHDQVGARADRLELQMRTGIWVFATDREK